VRSQFVIGSIDLALLTSSRSLLANKRHAGLNAGNSALLTLEVMVAGGGAQNRELRTITNHPHAFAAKF
jgi:hypothetical protein